MEEENIIYDEQNENEAIDNSIDSNDEELDDVVSFEASNSNQSKDIDIISERLKYNQKFQKQNFYSTKSKKISFSIPHSHYIFYQATSL